MTSDCSFKLAGTSTSTIDGIGLSYNVFFQGCSHSCANCQNPELQDFQGGQESNTTDIINYISNHKDFYDSIVLTGGDPIDQPNATYQISQVSLPTVLYTGYLFNQIPSDIIKNCNIIIDGPYDSLYATNGYTASTNQKVYINKNSFKATNQQLNNFINNHNLKKFYYF